MNRSVYVDIIAGVITFLEAGLRFRVDDRGPRDAVPIVFLHGFPQTAESWRPTMELLEGKGYRTIAFDQRGYSPGARPRQRRSYRLRAVTQDLFALLDAVGVEKAHIVGHDWGGVVAWTAAAQYPERLLSLIAVSTPHPRAFLSALPTSRQLFQSWYFLLFQLPRLPEKLILSDNGRIGRRWLRKSGLEASVAHHYVQRFLTDEGSLTSALNWYRALPLDARFGMDTREISVPTMYVHGSQDAFVSAKAARLTRKWVSSDYRNEVIPGASHWIPEAHPNELADLVTAWVAELGRRTRVPHR